MSRKRIVILLFFSIFVLTQVASGNSFKSSYPGNIYFRNYGIDEGLVNGSVNCIYQDHYGFIWIGTSNGLSRFDGYEFLNFREDPGDPKSPYSDFILRIYEDSQNRLWIGTHRSLELYNRQKKEFELKFPVYRDNLYVNEFYEDSRGILWAATAKEGMLRYRPEKDSFVVADMNSWYKYSISGLNDVVEDRNGCLWLASEDSGVYKVDMNQQKIKQFRYQPDDPNSLPHNSVQNLQIDQRQNIWMATYGGGISKYNPEKEEFTIYKKTPGEGSLSSNLVFSLLIDSQSNLWVVSESGLDLFQPENKTFHNYHHIEGKSNTLVNNKLWCIYEDPSKNLWLGHYLEGVSFTNFNNQRPFEILSEQTNPSGLSNKYVSAITRDNQGNIWIGTDGGGINIFDEHHNAVKLLEYQDKSRATNVILSFLKHSNGKIYYGTYRDGLYCYNPQNGQIKRFMHQGKTTLMQRHNDIRDMAEDENGNIWIATHGAGIDVFDPDKEQFTAHYGKYDSDIEQTLPYRWLNSIYLDKKRIAWIGSLGGMIRFDIPSQNITHLPDTSQFGLRSNRIFHVTGDGRGNLVIATDRGLCVHNTASDSSEWFTREDGLAHNNVKSILIDDNYNYWIGTFNGLSKYSPKTKKFVNFQSTDGLSGDQFINGAAYKSAEGRLFFGTTQGLTYFYPEEIKVDSALVPVCITRLKILNHEISPGEKIDNREVLEKSISMTDTISLKYDQSMFSIGFSAIHYTSPHDIRYKYKLEGFNETWIYTGAEDRTATYTNLEPGIYTFKVLATNRDGVWSGNPETLTVKIIPPFWMTLWFKLFIILLVIMLMVFIYFYRIKRIKRLNEKLTREVEARTSEISKKNQKLRQQTEELNQVNVALEKRQLQIEEQDRALREQSEQLKHTNEKLKNLNATKDRFFSIIGHDLKNPVNSLLGFSSLFRDRYYQLNDEKKLRYIDQIQFAAKQLYGLLENLLTWAKNQQEQIEYKPESIHFQELLNDSFKLIKSRTEEKHIEVLSQTIPDLVVYGDYNMLYAVIRNLLSNAVKFTPNKGKIAIETKLVENELAEVAISDTGKGIPEAVKEKLFDIDKNITLEGTEGEKGTGLGLIICRELLQKHNQELHIESEEGQGTRFYFYLPVVRV
jgi:signal transduction histidine kinase/ligand-binding sensor domain-containing protein